MRKIYYNIKATTASTNYMDISKEDMDFLINQVIQMQSYMSELSICPDKEIRDVVKWYNTPNKSLPYHSKWKKHNSPSSYIAGILNNHLYGSQRDIREVQAQHLQNILNMFVDITEALTELKIDLQKASKPESLLFSENIWITQP